jgi:hypothetical protein
MTQSSKSTGQGPAVLVVFVFAFYVVVSAGLGVLYAMGIWYSPFPYLNFVLLLAYASLTRLIGGLSIRVFKAGSPGLASFFVFLGITVGFYVSWAAWLTLFAHAGETVEALGRELTYVRSSLDPDTLLVFLQNPQEMFYLAKQIYLKGLWVFLGTMTPVRGPILLVLWILEYLIYMIMVVRDAWLKSIFVRVGK